MIKILSEYSFKDIARPKILITNRDIPEHLVGPLREKCDVTICEGDSRESILESCKGMDGILWITTDKLNGDVLEAAGPQLKAISTMTSGMDYVDSGVINERGVKLGYTPHAVNAPVAEVAVGLMIAAARGFHEGRIKLLNGELRPKLMLGMDIVGSTIGIVGFGGIGQTILKRLKGFDIGKCLYTGHNPKPEGKMLGAKFVNFDELLTESDFVFIVCPLNQETSKMFNETSFKKMKTSSVLINVARGGIVDQEALVKALKNGEIFGAGLDVMTPEPLEPNDPLLTLPNCVIVPHLGTATTNSLEEMFLITANNVLAGIAGECMMYAYK